jgi:hypothetical protein
MIHPGVATPAEYDDLPQTPRRFRSVGWTLGHHCPTAARTATARAPGWAVASSRARWWTRRRAARRRAESERPTSAATSRSTRRERRRRGSPRLRDPRPRRRGDPVGLTTNGTTLLALHTAAPRRFRGAQTTWTCRSTQPLRGRHDRSPRRPLYAVGHRGAGALRQTATCPRAVAYCPMAWNFDRAAALPRLVELCLVKGRQLRVNTPQTVRSDQPRARARSAGDFAGFAHLLSRVRHPWTSATTRWRRSRAAPSPGAAPAGGPRCASTRRRRPGRFFRQPLRVPARPPGADRSDGARPRRVVASPQFRVLRQRVPPNPERVEGSPLRAAGRLWGRLRGGAYLETLHREGRASLLAREPLLPAGARAPGVVPARASARRARRAGSTWTTSVPGSAGPPDRWRGC